MVTTLEHKILESLRFPDGSSIVRIEQVPWTNWAASGVTFKLLSANRGSGTWSALIRLEAGAALPDQYRMADAYVSVISGDGSCDDNPLSVRSFHVERGGRYYRLTAGGNGLLCYIIAFGGSAVEHGEGRRTIIDLDWLYDAAAANAAVGHLSPKPGPR